MIKKKGDAPGAGSAAILITVIAGMILLYTLFLPPDERAKLLQETNGPEKTDPNNINNILLKESPGRLDLVKKTEIEHKISSFNLITKTEGKLLSSLENIYVQRTIFSDTPQTLQFEILDPENTQNVLLSFYPRENKGRLIISINDNIISEKDYESTISDPISIPKNILKNSNTIKFSVSNPGIMFFATNKYSLENVKIFGDVTDRSNLINKQSIFFTSIERQNLEKATLSFMPTCKTTKIGKLSISINNQEIYSGIPDCKMPLKIDIGPGKILEGENTLSFISDGGSYVIDQAKIISYLKDSVFQTYYFNLDSEDLRDIKDKKLNINMSIIFVPSSDFQDVEVEINGRKFSIDNKKKIYTQIINSYVREDNNALSLRPLDGTVDIVELKVHKRYTNSTS